MSESMPDRTVDTNRSYDSDDEMFADLDAHRERTKATLCEFTHAVDRVLHSAKHWRKVLAEDPDRLTGPGAADIQIADEIERLRAECSRRGRLLDHAAARHGLSTEHCSECMEIANG